MLNFIQDMDTDVGQERKDLQSNIEGGQPSEAEEDERIEADQQQDMTEIANPKLNVTVDIVCDKGGNSISDEKQEEITQESDGESTNVPSDYEGEEQEQKGKGKKGEKSGKGKGKRHGKKKKEEKVEHKKPNINVGSRLADYIKSPLPVKLKEEKENTEAAKNKRNLGYVRKTKTEEEKGKSEGNEEKKPFKREKIEKEPPKLIKRAPPKSKWDAIMSKIEDKKCDPQPKKEVRSTLSAYMNSPPPALIKKEVETKQKKKLPNVPTPDYSKVKSKLNLTAAHPVANIRREMSPGPGKRDQSPRGKQTRALSLPGSAPPKLDLNESVGSSVLGSIQDALKGSQTELSVNGDTGGVGTERGEGSCPSTPKSLSKPSSKCYFYICFMRCNSLMSCQL